jgi:hypothetical protein
MVALESDECENDKFDSVVKRKAKEKRDDDLKG